MFSHFIYALEGKKFRGACGWRERKRATFPSEWDPKRVRGVVLTLIPQGHGHRALFCMNCSDVASLPVSQYFLLAPG